MTRNATTHLAAELLVGSTVYANAMANIHSATISMSSAGHTKCDKGDHKNWTTFEDFHGIHGKNDADETDTIDDHTVLERLR